MEVYSSYDLLENLSINSFASIKRTTTLFSGKRQNYDEQIFHVSSYIQWVCTTVKRIGKKYRKPQPGLTAIYKKIAADSNLFIE